MTEPTADMLAGESKRLAIALARLRSHVDSIRLHLEDPRPFGPEVGQSIASAAVDVATRLARVDTLRRLV